MRGKEGQRQRPGLGGGFRVVGGAGVAEEAVVGLREHDLSVGLVGGLQGVLEGAHDFGADMGVFAAPE